MPNIAAFHPQIVHFVIALAFTGVILRLVAFTPWFKFAGPAARALIIASALFSLAAVKSGDQAHGPAERIPGARDIVVEHEEAGESARTALLIVAALELAAWAVARKPKVGVAAAAVAAAAGLWSLTVLYHAGEHGGEVVFNYGGGVGTRSGDPAHIDNLLVAGLYQASQADRRAGRHDAAARLIAELARRRPDDPSVRLLVVESRIRDRGDARGALAQLDSLAAPGDSLANRVRFQAAQLRADAWLALGQRDSARLALEALGPAARTNPRIRARLDSLR